jgi:ABC-type multidrug transport system permease subunit
MNPAEYYLDLISIDYSSPEQEIASRNRIDVLAKAYKKSIAVDPPTATRSSSGSSDELAIKLGEGGMLNKLRSFGRQFKILFQRAFRQIVRDKPTNIARLMSGLFSALLFGSIYYKLGTGASTVADRLGLLQVAAVNTAMTSLIKATTSFVTEKLIVQRERKGNWYKVEPYFLSKLLAETPLSAFFPILSGGIMYYLCGLNPLPGRMFKFLAILVVESMAATALGMSVGSLATSVESAIAIAPAVMVIFIVFGGLYVVNTPSYLSWVPQISLIRWAYEALCVNEFSGLKLTPSAAIGPLSVSDGKQVLDSLGYGASTVRHAILAQLGIVAANYLFTYLSLKVQKPSFEQLLPYPIPGRANLEIIASADNIESVGQVEKEDVQVIDISASSAKAGAETMTVPMRGPML